MLAVGSMSGGMLAVRNRRSLVRNRRSGVRNRRSGAAASDKTCASLRRLHQSRDGRRGPRRRGRRRRRRRRRRLQGSGCSLLCAIKRSISSVALSRAPLRQGCHEPCHANIAPAPFKRNWRRGTNRGIGGRLHCTLHLPRMRGVCLWVPERRVVTEEGIPAPRPHVFLRMSRARTFDQQLISFHASRHISQ
jgi:hypothetical protein